MASKKAKTTATPKKAARNEEVLTDRERAIRAAAIIDTDGYISISYQCVVCCGVTSVDDRILEWLIDAYGGAAWENNHKIEDGYNRRPIKHWKISAQKAEKFLKSIEPFLLLKREQALLALELRTLQGYQQRKIPADEKLAMWKPYESKMKHLNGSRFSVQWDAI